MTVRTPKGYMKEAEYKRLKTFVKPSFVNRNHFMFKRLSIGNTEMPYYEV